jgi:hypothetical protein
MYEKEEYDWKFNRVNSKGELIFKHKTEQTVEDVCKFLDKHKVKYEKRLGATMLWIYFQGKEYAYYYTTGRWHTFVMNGYPKKHYHAKGIKDFYNRFLLPNANEEYVVDESVEDVKNILNKYKINYKIKNNIVTLISKPVPRKDGKGNLKKFIYEYHVGKGRWKQIRDNYSNNTLYKTKGIKDFANFFDRLQYNQKYRYEEVSYKKWKKEKM